MSDSAIAVGKPLQRIDGIDKVTGSAKYAADIKLDNMLHAKLLRSPHAHARVKHIDISAPEKLPGVRAVATILEVPKVIEYWFSLRTEKKKKQMFCAIMWSGSSGIRWWPWRPMIRRQQTKPSPWLR